MRDLSQAIIFSLIVILIASCSSQPQQITGKWVIPITGQPNKSWGFELKKDGKAKSINTSTLQYEAWILSNDTLFLSGKSIGIGQTISFTDTLIVKNLSTNSLSLITTSGYELAYTLLE